MHLLTARSPAPPTMSTNTPQAVPSSSLQTYTSNREVLAVWHLHGLTSRKESPLQKGIACRNPVILLSCNKIRAKEAIKLPDKHADMWTDGQKSFGYKLFCRISDSRVSHEKNLFFVSRTDLYSVWLLCAALDCTACQTTNLVERRVLLSGSIYQGAVSVYVFALPSSSGYS
jgi:hypothetical protein